MKTPDNVLFIADALAPLYEMEDNPIPYVENVTQYKKSLDYLLNSPCNLFVPTHGDLIEFSLSNEILSNVMQVQLIEEAIIMHLRMPRTKEELIALLFATFEIPETIPNFYRISTSVVAFLNCLKRETKITIIHEGGKTRWFAKP